jgi:hypothetical protein
MWRNLYFDKSLKDFDKSDPAASIITKRQTNSYYNMSAMNGTLLMSMFVVATSTYARVGGWCSRPSFNVARG